MRFCTLKYAGNTTVEIDAGAGDVACGIGRKEGDDIGDFLCFAGTLEGNVLDHLAVVLVGTDAFLGVAALVLALFDLADADGVYEYVVSGKFLRQGLGNGEAGCPRYRRRVGSGARLLGAGYGDVDDATAAALFHVRNDQP